MTMRVVGDKLVKKFFLVMVISAIAGFALQGCATAKGAAAGAAIGGLAGDASKGAKIGATAGFVVDVFD
jgi:hypothetical protein